MNVICEKQVMEITKSWRFLLCLSLRKQRKAFPKKKNLNANAAVPWKAMFQPDHQAARPAVDLPKIPSERQWKVFQAKIILISQRRQRNQAVKVLAPGNNL